MPPTLIRIESEAAFSSPVAVTAPIGDHVAQVRVAAHTLVSIGSMGVWESTPGRFRRQVPQAEYSYVICGCGVFRPDGGQPIEFRTGDSIYLDANTQGEWELHETVRKAYILVK